MEDTKNTTTIEPTDWRNLYGESWKGLITDEAFAHPAKFSRALIGKIYSHLIEEGLLKPGDTVLDPFGGVALGGFNAMRLGLHWVGMELEEKFFTLGNGNIDLWRERYPWFPGTATLLNGDSRKLCQAIGCQVSGGAVSSPPYAESVNQHDAANDTARRLERMAAAGLDIADPATVGGQNGGYTIAQNYGSTPGQLGGMKEGDFSAAITSPPYDQARIDGQGDEGASGLRNADGSFVRGSEGWEQRKALGGRYGDTDGNLANLPSGDFGAAVSSPPFLQTSGGKGIPYENGSLSDKGLMARHAAGNSAVGYGASEGQLASMPDEGFTAAISSPPFGEAQTGGGIAVKGYQNAAQRPGSEEKPFDLVGERSYMPGTQGQADGQLAGMKMDDFDGAIASPPFGDALGRDVVNAEARREWARAHGISNAEHVSPVDMERIGARDQEYGQTEGQMGTMKTNDFDAAVTSPPYEGSDQNYKEGWARFHANHEPLHKNDIQREAHYGESDGQIGNTSGDSFWHAAREIVEQVYLLLAPGAPAVWVCKDYVRNKQIVPFCDQWRQLCEAVGFETLHLHRAWLVEERGTQYDLLGEKHTKTVERKSFFRRLAEKKGSPRIDWEMVICMRKPQGDTRE